MAVGAARTKKSIYKVNNFRYFFFRRVDLNLMFFQEELASLLTMGKPFSGNLEG